MLTSIQQSGYNALYGEFWESVIVRKPALEIDELALDLLQLKALWKSKQKKEIIAYINQHFSDFFDLDKKLLDILVPEWEKIVE